MRKPTLLCALLLLAGQLAQAADSVLIGLSLPRTGHYRAGAVDVAQGALLAVDDINAQGGVLSKRLVLDIRDSGSNVEQAQRNVTAFAAQGAAHGNGRRQYGGNHCGRPSGGQPAHAVLGRVQSCQ